jgi:hypothetical protein
MRSLSVLIEVPHRGGENEVGFREDGAHEIDVALPDFLGILDAVRLVEVSTD